MNKKLWLAGRAATVGAHVIAEKVRTVPPRTAADVPANGVTLTTDRLTAVLCRDVPGAHVEVASRAEVSETLVYRYVGSKAGLFEESIIGPARSLVDGFLVD